MPRNSHDGSYGRFIEMETIAKLYFSRHKYNKSIGEEQQQKISKKELSISKFEKTCNALCEPYKTILNNTFFEKKNLYWWEGVYSKTTYYRLRDKAIKTFLLVYKIQ